MIIAKAPFRISFVGGGSDLPSFYKKYGGAVLSTSINKYVYILIKDRFEETIRCSYSKTEIVKSVKELEHDLVRNALTDLDITKSLEIVSSADIPSSGTGLGSSSSFSVALYNALFAYLGKRIKPKELAERACRLEIELVGSPIGKQDQYAAAFGGLNFYKFNTDDTVTINPIKVKSDFYEKLNKSLISFYIGGKRDANKILSGQSDNLNEKKNVNTLKRMVELAWALKEEFENSNLDNFGTILNENWSLKKTLQNDISNNKVDDIYNECINLGATGGKLLGAGGGGFMIFIVPNEDIKNRIRTKLSSLREVVFNLTNEGSQIVYED